MTEDDHMHGGLEAFECGRAYDEDSFLYLYWTVFTRMTYLGFGRQNPFEVESMLKEKKCKYEVYQGISAPVCAALSA